jgi:hypothetical protein
MKTIKTTLISALLCLIAGSAVASDMNNNDFDLVFAGGKVLQTCYPCKYIVQGKSYPGHTFSRPWGPHMPVCYSGPCS